MFLPTNQSDAMWNSLGPKSFEICYPLHIKKSWDFFIISATYKNVLYDILNLHNSESLNMDCNVSKVYVL